MGEESHALEAKNTELKTRVAIAELESAHQIMTSHVQLLLCPLVRDIIALLRGCYSGAALLRIIILFYVRFEIDSFGLLPSIGQ